MFISDLNHLEVASETIVGGGRRGGGDRVKIYVYQSNYNETYQKADADAYSKYDDAKAYASNYNETYQSNKIDDIVVYA